MKKLKKICLLFLGITFMLFSCSDDFLETNPTESVSENEAVATTKNLRAVLNGIHRSLYERHPGNESSGNGRGGIGAMMINMDVLGEDYVMTAAANGWFNNMYKWIDHRNTIDNDNLFPYRMYYRINRNANVIINNVIDASGPISEKDNLLGQALFYRAFIHYQLVQLYGKRYQAGQNNSQLGIPIVLSADADSSARETVEEVYKQINVDLDSAIDLLSADRSNASHINKGVVLGLKARVALTQGAWEIAARNAKQARNDFQLMSRDDYKQGFNDYTNDEWMWGSHIVEDQTEFFGNFGAFISRNFNSTNIRANPKAINSLLYATIPSTDVRSELFDPTGEHNNLPAGVTISSRHSKHAYTSQKFLSRSTGDSRVDVPYMRAAEMYLIEAEAKARLGEVDAVDVLADLARARDPEYVKSTKTGQALVDEILLQRRWELWGEGFRFYDLKRLNAPLDRTGANHSATLVQSVFEVPIGDDRWQWVFHQDIINANSLIKQND